MISAGDDKEVHVWRRTDVGDTGWLHRRTIRWPVTRGPRGRIYAARLNDDLVAFAENQGWVGSKQVELTLSPVHNRPCGSLEESDFHGEMLSRVLDMTQEIPPLRHWHLDGWTVVNYFKRLLDEERVVLPRFHHCEATIGKSFHLDMGGKIYTCIEACGMEEYASGEYLPKLQFYPLYEQLRHRSVVNMDRCQTCNIALVCGGGCALQSIYDHTSLATPVCAGIKRDLATFVQHRFQESVPAL